MDIDSKMKKEKGIDFINRMKNKYQSIANLEKIVNETKNMKLLVDLDNWKYLNKHLDEYIEHGYITINK